MVPSAGPTDIRYAAPPFPVTRKSTKRAGSHHRGMTTLPPYTEPEEAATLEVDSL